jgi:hypothetical protein
MSIHFVYSAHPMRANAVEPMFSDECIAIRNLGHSVSFCPDAVIQGSGKLVNIPVGAKVIYRGWMQNENEYRNFCAAVVSASAVPFTSPEAYLSVHHLPNWYPLISEFTPETRVYAKDQISETELRSLGWERFFIKDYVKSIKTSVGSMITDPSQINLLLSEMKRIRGEIEGGICVRRYERLLPESERRYFVIDGIPHSPSVEATPEIVHQIVPRISSRFYSVDVIRREDGVLRIVEIGDGQVSDLVGWSASRFAEIWNSLRG